MKNPFEYGGVVTGEAFCNRRKELNDLCRAMENSEKLFVFSERRFGKTSLALRSLRKLPQKNFITAYVDLWPTDGETSFATTMARGLTQALANTPRMILEVSRNLFGRLSPTIITDEQGTPTVRFEFNKSRPDPPELEEVLSSPARIAQKRGKKVVIIFDEFQQILEYESDLVERQMRSLIQRHKDVAYIFLGSRKHLIKKMVLDRARPLYQAGGHYPLGPIAERHWRPFIQKKFVAADKIIDVATIVDLCEFTEGHPFYTQHLSHALWELCEPGEKVTPAMMELALSLLLQRESYAYTALWESFSKNARRFLKGLANEPPGVQPFSGKFVRAYRLGSASNAQRAVDSLLTGDVIDHENGSFIIVDRFFKLWIKRLI